VFEGAVFEGAVFQDAVFEDAAFGQRSDASASGLISPASLVRSRGRG